MPRDILGDGLAALTAKMAAHASVAAVYSDGAHSVTIAVTPGPVRMRTKEAAANVKIEAGDRDFCAPVAALILNGSAVRPSRGHSLTLTAGGVTKRYDVHPLGDDGPARLIDGDTSWRIHTKYKGVV